MAALPSTYSDSIKFYDRMSHLQGELKTYEAQQFELEEELRRLQRATTTTTSKASSSNIGLEPKTPTTGELGHLSGKSQLHSHPSTYSFHTPQISGDEGRRRRNQAILDKLQELETNASIFAARSERLRMMKIEYENLARKHATHMKSGSKDYVGKSRGFSSGIQGPQNPPAIRLTSTGVNTDITGPVKPLTTSSSTANIDIPREEETRLPEKDNGNGISELMVRRRSHEVEAAAAISNRHQKTQEITHPLQASNFLSRTNVSSFLDSSILMKPKPLFSENISSTSESGDLRLIRNGLLHSFDGNSETTSDLSVLLPKSQSRGLNYTGSISSTSTLTETPEEPSSNFNQHPLIKEIPEKTDGLLQAERDTQEVEPEIDTQRKCLISSRREEEVDHQKNEVDDESIANDSTAHSVGDSLMDSICNKTPESLPRDESELAGITEEESNEDGKDQQDLSENEKRLISETKEAFAAFTNKMKENEICSKSPFKGSQGFQFQAEKPEKDKGPSNGIEKDADANEEGTNENVEEGKEEEDLHSKVSHPFFGEVQRYQESQKEVTQTDAKEIRWESGNLVEENDAHNSRQKLSSKPEPVLKPQNAKKSKDLAPPKKMHLKLDYDDSGSDQSETGAVDNSNKGLNSKPTTLSATKPQGPSNDLDEEFGDFFD